jgi:molybdenum cofactor cytidylyltransferase
MTAAIVLAAGASTRLGEPKQLVVLGGETLLERAVRVARDAGCAPIVVVLGANSEQIRERSNLGDAVVALNELWSEGMATSIHVGIEAAKASDGVVLMTCDQPAATAGHLRKLTGSNEITASAYAGRRGVPAYFPAGSFAALMQLRGDAGARELLRDAASIELPYGELDVDTLLDLAQARESFR